jgi:hypothetical protein
MKEVLVYLLWIQVIPLSLRPIIIVNPKQANVTLVHSSAKTVIGRDFTVGRGKGVN